MLRLQGCVYLFEWATPIVCSDATSMSGCQLNDSQLQFSFDLSVLSGEIQVTIRVFYADIGWMYRRLFLFVVSTTDE